MITVFLGLAAASSLAPFFLPLSRVSPLTAGAIWFSSLLARVAVVTATVVIVASTFYRGELFHRFQELCVHLVAPFADARLGLTRHPLVDILILMPLILIGIRVAHHIRELAIARRAADNWLLVRATGDGPNGSLVVEDRRSWLAVVGLFRGRVVISNAALERLDQNELRAGLEHEAAHLRRGHKLILLIASFLTVLSSPMPGTRRAEAELSHCLERDADEATVRRTKDPLALASAICKSALPAGMPASMALDGTMHTRQRLDDLLHGGRRRAPRAIEAGHAAVALSCVTVALAFTAMVPSLVMSAVTTGFVHALAVCA